MNYRTVGRLVIAAAICTLIGCFANNFKDDTIILKADGTFRRSNTMMGGYGGTWTLSGDKLTMTNGADESELLRGKSVTFTAEGAQLVNHQDGGFNFFYDRAPADSGEPKAKLTAYQFFAEYKADPAAAKAKYDGQLIELSGTVDSVNMSYGGDYWLAISSPPPATATGPAVQPGLLDGVKVITLDKEPFVRLAPGQTATFRGKGFMWSGPTINEAEIVSSGPPTAITMAATDLASEFAANPDATAKKYETGAISGKMMILTGNFISAEKEKDGNDLIGVWIGTADKKVYCHVDRTSDTNKRLAALKPGEPLKLVGEYSGASSTDKKSPSLRMSKFATVK